MRKLKEICLRTCIKDLLASKAIKRPRNRKRKRKDVKDKQNSLEKREKQRAAKNKSIRKHKNRKSKMRRKRKSPRDTSIRKVVVLHNRGAREFTRLLESNILTSNGIQVLSSRTSKRRRSQRRSPLKPARSRRKIRK